MSKNALLIPRPGMTSSVSLTGYVDALRKMGWKVITCNPQNKANCKNWISEYNINLIMTSSKYGVSQLPIGDINDREIDVVVEALPLNNKRLNLDGPYEVADPKEISIISEINNCAVISKMEPGAWDKYMSTWISSGIKITHVPSAGNILRAKPSSMEILFDVGMVANLEHKKGAFLRLIKPLFDRLKMLGYTYQAFGDRVWQSHGIDYSGPLLGEIGKLANVYSSSLVCPNIHTDKQISPETYINERSFMIPLCGGIQVSDNILAKKYLGESCFIGSDANSFINKVIDNIKDGDSRRNKIKEGVRHVSENHTYFNRLCVIFDKLGMKEEKSMTETEGQRLSEKHCWGINTMLDAQKRGVTYEQNIVSN